ncbi:MAG TPA: tetratricopeptide repeat protein [Gemmatimonadaceae bacterium]
MSLRALALALGLTVISRAALAQAQDPATRVDRAVRLVDEHRFDEARSELTTLTTQRPLNARVPLALDRVHLAERETEQAIEWLERAVDLDTTSADARLWLGRAIMEHARTASKFRRPGLARRVKAAFERAVALDPRSVDARRALLDFYLMAPSALGGGKDRARAQADSIHSLSYLRGRLAYAAIRQKQKDVAGAVQELRAALEEYPDTVAAHYAMAELWTAAGALDSAAAAYDGLLTRWPGEYRARCELGRVWTRMDGGLERAARALDECLRATPDHDGPAVAEAHFAVGALYERRGEVGRAESEYQAALQRVPRHREAKKALEGLR